MIVVKPETVIDWQNRRFKRHWTKLSTKNKNPVEREQKKEIRDFIYLMAEENRWGAPRIYSELLMLGFDDISEANVSRYLRKFRSNKVKIRYGAIGEHGSIAVTERVIETLKYEWLKKAAIIRGFRHLTNVCSDFAECYNNWRPHLAFVKGITFSRLGTTCLYFYPLNALFHWFRGGVKLWGCRAERRRTGRRNAYTYLWQ
ncbi:MAG: transposase [Proteobacteria bacterium]|nr:transposase [Pseudomonadota bacterium]